MPVGRRAGAGDRRSVARPSHPADRSRRGQSRRAARRRGRGSAAGARARASASRARSDRSQAGGSRWRGRPQEAAALDAALAIEAIAGADGAGLQDLAAALSRVRRSTSLGCSSLPTARWSPTRRSSPRRARRSPQAGVETLVGGGTRAYFTELNRATLPLDAMDVVSYTLNPQVHAFDNASMTETLAAQPETVRSARAIVGDRPLVVGPITLRPRFNPNATGPEPKPAPGELPAVGRLSPAIALRRRLAGREHQRARQRRRGCADLFRNHRLARAHRAPGSPAARRRVPLLAGDGLPRLSRAGRRRVSFGAGRSCRSRWATGCACRRWRCAMATGCASSWRT